MLFAFEVSLAQVELDVDRLNDSVDVEFHTKSGMRYQIYTSADIDSGDWVETGDAVQGDGEVYTFNFPLENQLTRFFKVVEDQGGGALVSEDVIIEDLEMTLKSIPSGTFVMGSSGDEEFRRNLDEVPATTVTISQPFWLGATEVTQAQWESLMEPRSLWFTGATDLPVRANWLQAMAFCRELTKRERQSGRLPDGYEFNLPTEAQWEYACRAGTTTKFYYGDDDSVYSQLSDYAWYWSNSGREIHPVAQKPENPWGLYDMHGNVLELCRDWAGGDYPGGAIRDPMGPISGGWWVGRGGSVSGGGGHSRSASRGRIDLKVSSIGPGFRVALVPVSLSNTGSIPDLASLNIEMVPIPAGTFMMGSPDDERGRNDNEGPQTEVTFSKPFWLGRTEVTQAQWKAVMGTNPSHFKGDDQRPVESLTWYEAFAFCERLTGSERQAGRLPAGYRYSLPTETQWEYACRAGTTTRYYYGDDLRYGQLVDYCWNRRNSREETHRVGEKLPNGWGLFDMHGNVVELTFSYYGDHLPSRNLISYSPRSLVSHRGGGYSFSNPACRSSSRIWGAAAFTASVLGFRVALVPDH